MVRSRTAVVVGLLGLQQTVDAFGVAPRAIVEYRDKFRRTAKGWRIAERQYQYDFLKAE